MIPKRPKPRVPAPILALVAVLASLGLSSCAGAPEPAAPGEPAIGIEELSRLDLLPRFRSSVKVGLVSSYDRTGGNDDGFSGAYSFIRKEEGGLVLADLPGPGVITRIHTPTPTDDLLEFYFDGEAAPRIGLKMTELYDGTHPPFLAPLVVTGAGGYTSYVPLTYRKSCKILLRAESFKFYDINYAVYPAGADVPTFENPPSEGFKRRFAEASRLFARAGSDISDAVAPPGAAVTRTAVQGSLAPGGTLTLFQSSRPGRIVGLKIAPASALAGAGRDIVLRAFWDGAAEPAVNCPAGDFFGASFGEPAVRSLLLGTDEDEDYVYLPMPFERSARIELVSERTGGAPVNVRAEVVHSPAGKRPDEGRFTALWRRENPTTPGVPYTYLRAAGRGHVVGVILQAQGIESGSTPFFEGDDRAAIDGDMAIFGTGSEDSFNGGYYDIPGRWESRVSLPLSGCLDYKKALARTGGYRFMITDAYAYSKSIDYTIEHGPEGNAVPTDYASVVFFYSQDPPKPDSPLPPAASRKVTGLGRIVFTPGWNVPIRTTSLSNAVWTKSVEKIGGNNVRYFSMRTTGPFRYGHHVSFICDLPEAGRYKVSVKAVLGPDQGILRIFERDRPAGEPANLYAPSRMLSGELPLGAFEMRRGENAVYFHLAGADPRSKGTGFDLVEIVFEKI